MLHSQALEYNKGQKNITKKMTQSNKLGTALNACIIKTGGSVLCQHYWMCTTSLPTKRRG